MIGLETGAMKPPIRVYLIADEAAAAGWRFVLENSADLALIGQSPDFAHAAGVLAGAGPDVIVWDAEIAALIESEAIASCTQVHPGRVLVICAPRDEYLMLELLRQGAWGYKLKNDRLVQELADAVRTLDAGGAVVGSQLAGRMLDQLAGRTEEELPDHLS